MGPVSYALVLVCVIAGQMRAACAKSWLECLEKDTQHRARFRWRGELIAVAEIRLQGHSSAPVPFDIDGNGTLDIVSGCEDGNIYWFKREWIESHRR